MSNNFRNFNISDAILIEHAEKVAKSLNSDVTQFNNFDTTISESYPSNIVNAVKNVMSIKSDTIIIDEQTELTQDLSDVMSECNQSYRTIAYFVRKIYPDNKAVQNQFGLNDIDKARGKQAQMVLFMESLNKVANSYKDELCNNGCNAIVVESLPTLVDKLRTANINQETFKSERGLKTQERTQKLNELYALLVPISQIAQIIYADDMARLDLYTLPRPKMSNNSVDDLEMS